MALAQRDWATRLLQTWFGVLGPPDWFRQSDAVDDMLRQRFADDWRRLSGSTPRDFLIDPPTTLAAVLLFDQIPRNLFRGSAQAFASDDLAVTLTHAALDRGWHRGMPHRQIQFLAMPLMHSESRADQRRCVKVFARHVPGALDFARSHRTMIETFGRFPHRNEVLGAHDNSSRAARDRRRV